MTGLLDVEGRRRTYRTLLYLLLGLPLGVFEFSVVITGLALGVGLFVTLLGIPVLVATLLVARGLATMERRLARSLLEVSVPEPSPDRRQAPGMFWARLRELGSRRTWADVGYILLRLPLGVLDFVIATTILGLMLIGLIYPIIVLAGVDAQIGSWTIDTIGESLVFLPVSVVAILVGPSILVSWGAVSGRIAVSFLGRGQKDSLDTGPIEGERVRVEGVTTAPTR